MRRIPQRLVNFRAGSADPSVSERTFLTLALRAWNWESGIHCSSTLLGRKNRIFPDNWRCCINDWRTRTIIHEFPIFIDIPLFVVARMPVNRLVFYLWTYPLFAA